MKLFWGLLFLGFSFVSGTALAQVPGCLTNNPHSFACQQGTFFGRIFPLVPASSKALTGNWRAFVYAPAPRQAALFRPRFSPRNPRIPTGIVNSDNSLVGSLFWPGTKGLRFPNFRVAGNNLQQIGDVRLSDQMTAQVPFFNPREGTRELFICRVFVRNRTEHLLCQWLRNSSQGFTMMGYFGFIR
ncbi:hypothetical protein AZI86_01330 [Bdellovibrio bacteriovorus]|uniref:Uncharacterized protein n=1 Tax=Bdellovibrio bacteriovorus TaxID=959 RepID=A0A150WMZ7_BDEBC|nr:hypothetical protein [Bdellovibrio bacteriovorus]KYG65746.1 hypothetical protein AZI86_01330 [Bdellovibrio bacteriovorus]